jgi:hypothetical protein
MKDVLDLRQKVAQFKVMIFGKIIPPTLLQLCALQTYPRSH